MIWDAETLATGAQFLMAAALAVHVLVARPRAARESLTLAARIIGDDVTLDQNHGLLPVRDAEVERVRQLVARVVHDPATAKSVLLAADAELATRPADEAPGVDRIRVEAYLTRLADACARYQHDAWPLNGASQRARHAFRPGPSTTPPVEAEEHALPEAADVPEVIDLGEVEPRRIDLDALEGQDDPQATVERPAVLLVPAPATSAEDFDVEERRITTRLRAQIDLTRLKQGDRSVQVPTGWQPPQRRDQ
jgi:hypothetical protein